MSVAALPARAVLHGAAEGVHGLAARAARQYRDGACVARHAPARGVARHTARARARHGRDGRDVLACAAAPRFHARHEGDLMTDDIHPRAQLTVRISAMPADTNVFGDIFGGWVLSRMDQAGGIAAIERANGRVVTIALDAMKFIRPVKVGDTLEVYTAVESIGRTAMVIHVEAWARRFQTQIH